MMQETILLLGGISSSKNQFLLQQRHDYLAVGKQFSSGGVVQGLYVLIDLMGHHGFDCQNSPNGQDFSPPLTNQRAGVQAQSRDDSVHSSGL
jgi:hypothetical protein